MFFGALDRFTRHFADRLSDERQVGVVTELFKDLGPIDGKNTIGIVCGPPAMYKFVLPHMVKLGLPKHHILMTLERRMKCGVGKCGHCAIEYLYTCMDGPVFSYWDVLHMKENHREGSQ